MPRNSYLLVMPLTDRNLFVALKQERWTGSNLEEVRHVFVQLIHCVEHMHEKGVLHADLKTLNIVRTAGQRKLIDLDGIIDHVSLARNLWVTNPVVPMYHQKLFMSTKKRILPVYVCTFRCGSVQG